jgi:hypothetical protein
MDLFRSSGEGAGKTPTQLGPLERANLNHWATPVGFTYWDQANSVGDNKKIYNKNCDRARTCVELG